jgi:hypothetical protein
MSISAIVDLSYVDIDRFHNALTVCLCTFAYRLHMGVTMSSVSVAVLAFGANGHVSQYYALAMLPVSLMFCGYALYTFQWRAARYAMICYYTTIQSCTYR